MSIIDLLEKDTLETQLESDNVRVCYQNSRGRRNSSRPKLRRSLLLFANAEIFEKQASKTSHASKFRPDKHRYYTTVEIREQSYDIAGKITSKSDFAFDILMLDGWKTPKYIEEGLKWLAQASQSK